MARRLPQTLGVMTNTTASFWIPVSRIVVAGALLTSCGSYFLYDGLLALTAGQSLIVGKHFRPFIAYASGPNAEAFHFRIYTQLGFSSLLVLAGLALPATLPFMPAKRRTTTLNLFGGSSASTLGHTPWVAALAVSLGLVVMLVLRVTESS